MSKLTKKQRKMKLKVQLLESMYARRVWQDQPWTFVKFRVKVPPTKGDGIDSIETFGFSKVSHPDDWDAVYGLELAEDKALARAARIIMEKWG